MADSIERFNILFRKLVEDRIDSVLYLINVINNLFLNVGLTSLTKREKIIITLLSEYILLKEKNNG